MHNLDGSWEKRLRRGVIAPDMSIDLHEHSLAQAHARLVSAMGFAIEAGHRVLLVVTGKPRKSAIGGGSNARGAIAAQIGHWLEAMPLAHSIAAVRTAHPRHGGTGAIYVILRRKK